MLRGSLTLKGSLTLRGSLNMATSQFLTLLRSVVCVGYNKLAKRIKPNQNTYTSASPELTPAICVQRFTFSFTLKYFCKLRFQRFSLI